MVTASLRATEPVTNALTTAHSALRALAPVNSVTKDSPQPITVAASLETRRKNPARKASI